MTAQSKSTIKSYFETGDKPNQSQFGDFIDSYQDAATNLGTLTSASLGTLGLQLLATNTSASAQSILGFGTAATKNTGTSGGTVPLLNTANTWSGQQSITSAAFDLQVGQISFPATQNPSANVNTLDDYEEGTWTPSLGGNTTYNAQTGLYTKIGDFVYATMHIAVNTIGTGNTGIISGLPFSSTDLMAGSVGYFTTSNTSVVFISCYATGTTIHITGLAAGSINITDPISFFTNGTQIYLTVCYRV